MEKWPNFFIVGAAKAGTTSLYEYLNNIPGVYMSPLKEPGYFAITVIPEDFHIKPIRDKKKYLNLFKKVKDEIAIGEASAAYLRDPQAPILIQKMVPHAKIIIMLRDPIERAYSHYLADIRRGTTNRSFSEIIDLKIRLNDKERHSREIVIDPGFYSEQVKRYLDIFGSKQVMVIIFEEFIKETQKKMRQVLKFLEIKTNHLMNEEHIFNVYKEPRNKIASSVLRNKIIRKAAKHLLPSNFNLMVIEKILNKEGVKPRMSPNEKLILKEIYLKDVLKLKNILGRSLPWQNFQN